MPSLAHKRGTRAQIDAAAMSSGLKPGEVYLITDEARLTVGTAINTHVPVAKQSEAIGGDPWTWQTLSNDVSNSTITLAAVTGLSFAATANTTYLVDVIGAFQSAIATTGIATTASAPSATATLDVFMFLPGNAYVARRPHCSGTRREEP